jgi:hypothetical protein
MSRIENHSIHPRPLGFMLFLCLAPFLFAACDDHNINNFPGKVMKFLGTFKGSTSFKLFGSDAFGRFPRADNFQVFKSQIGNYLFGELVPAVPILMFTGAAFVAFAASSIMS